MVGDAGVTMKTDRQAKALNNDSTEQLTGVALNIALGDDGKAPEWVELLPAGEVKGIDGRSWINDQPQGVLAYFGRLKAHNRAMVIDYEHASEHKAPKGDPAPAAGWVEEMEIREGAVWGRVTWTPRGTEAVANREYRYLSPVLIYTKAANRVVGIDTAGLTNKPNLKLKALNREGQPQPQEEEEKAMLKKLLAALALPEMATEEQALNAVSKIKGDLATATNRAETPSLEKFVPRADYDQALTRATNAEQALTVHKKAGLEAEITTEIDAALKAGKITPATADYHRASCRQEGGLELFKKYVAAAPVVGDPSNLDGKEPDKDKGLALNADQARIAGMFGNSAEDLKKYSSQ